MLAKRLGRSVYPTSVTPLSVTTTSSLTVPAMFPPRSAARSTQTEPGFMFARASSFQSSGAFLPGISAVVMTMSISFACSAKSAISAAMNSGDITLA